MKIKQQTFFLLGLCSLFMTSCVIQERHKSSIVNLSSVDITIHYTRYRTASGSSSITISPHREFITNQGEDVYYVGSHIDDTPTFAFMVDSITSSLGKASNTLENEVHEYKKGGVRFNKYVTIVRDSSF